MAEENTALLAFNRGIISPLGLARTDVDRTKLSAEQQNNWMPRELGSMSLRPGLETIESTDSGDLMKPIPFVFDTDDTALLEFTDQLMRVRVDDTLVTRPSVSASISNGAFTSNLTGWTDNDETGATSAWATGGYMSLVGTGFNLAIRYQQVTLGNSGVVHACRIVIETGEAMFRIGSTAGGQEFLEEQTLKEGTHSIAFVPTANFYVQFSARTQYATLVDSISIESSGTFTLPTPWTEANLDLIRHDASADVIFVANTTSVHHRRIERRDNNSWSIIKYLPKDGPFRSENTDPVSLTASATTGDITLTADKDVFTSGNVGGLFRIESTGQQVTADLAGADQFTDAIEVTGFGSDERAFSWEITGTWSGTITAQYSIGTEGSWVDEFTRTSNDSNSAFDDNFDDQTVFWRFGFKTGEYTSGTATVELIYARGSKRGIVRVSGYTNARSVDAQVLESMGNTESSQSWWEGEWSDRRGYPTSVAFFDGRLWWAGKDRHWGSVSDAYESFDDEIEGNSGPISRNIGSGPIETIKWMLPLQRIVLGGGSGEHSVRASSFDETLTPDNYGIRIASTQGSADIAAVKVDADGIFVHRNKRRVYELALTGTTLDYTATDLSLIAPNVLDAGIVAIAAQRKPDTRIHCILADGTAAILLRDPQENLLAWVTMDSETTFKDVVVLPDNTTQEDAVYYVVEYGGTHYLTRWALESEAVGGNVNKQADLFTHYTGPTTAAITVESYFSNTELAVWADGKSLGLLTPSGTTLSLGAAYTDVVYGLPYTARFKSSKLAEAAVRGSALVQRKRIPQLGVILKDTHYQGLEYGPDFDNLDPLPALEDGEAVAADTVHATYDEDMFEFPGIWDSDSRLCLQASAPKPCTILAAVLMVETQEKFKPRRRE